MIGRDYNPTPEQRAQDDRDEAARLAMIARRNRIALEAFERRTGSRARHA